ncbi:MAG: hypothetical protein ABFR75_02070 [Acidobacteriota bacterium]
MENRIKKYVVGISILIHIILFFLIETGINLKLIGQLELPAETEISKPIVFDLEDEKKPKQVIETPENSTVEKKDRKADYFSDKDSSAKNIARNEIPKEDKPFSKGDIESPTLPEITKKSEEIVKHEDPSEKKTEKDKEFKPEELIDNSADSFLRDYEIYKKKVEKEKKSNRKNDLLYKNILSKVKEVGGFAFNTYNWDFAPYMLDMKRKIQNNIFPPIAFTKLGIIDGETLIRFRIYPDGELKHIELLNFKGHKTLMETSLKAVEISAPFPRLPSDFPRPYLEVTGKFIYFVRK